MSLPTGWNEVTVGKSENKHMKLVQETGNDFDKLDDLSEGRVGNGVMASKVMYFGVHIPNDCAENCRPSDNVFTDKLEALKALKKNKKARFKVFTSRKEAEDFVINGFEQPTPIYAVTASPSVGEKPMLFKGPKSQDLVRLRKAIESGDLEAVQTIVLDNPRFLISSGDTPTVLQEGSRYNALHVATKAKRANIVEFIINTIGDPLFVGGLYGDDNMDSCTERSRVLLDLYLNTPDKGLNDTPLHFAVKFGAKEVVEILVACPQCDRNAKNKFGQSAKEMICSRDNNATASLKQEIAKLLEDQYYVPVLRAEDNSSQPIIGLPFSPVCPLVLNTSPMESRVQIQAYAGPMSEEQATVFRKKWKTPPRNNPNSPSGFINRRLRDPEKGLECVGRNLAAEFGFEWKEYWPFIDSFIDLTTVEGLTKLEEFFKARFVAEGLKFSQRNIDVLNVTQLNITDKDITEHNLTVPKSGEALSPMSYLCHTLEACSLLDKSQEIKSTYRGVSIPYKATDISNRNEEEDVLNMITNPGLSPFLCVEKSCLVYGKRISHCLQLVVAIRDVALDMLKQEVKHLQTLVCSYMDDPRFVSVDFHLIHSRIASIVCCQLCSLTPEDLDLITNFCSEITANPSMYCNSSDEEELIVPTETYRNKANTEKKSKKDASMFNDHIKCIVKQIREGLKSEDHGQENIANEEDCIRLWSDAVKCSCHWQTQCFLRNSRKSSSYKRLKYNSLKKLKFSGNGSNGEGDNAARRLNYDSFQDASFQEEFFMPIGDVPMFKSHVKEESDTDEEESFVTPPSSWKGSDSSDDDEMSTAEEDEQVFIYGSTATSTDISVFHAIEHCRITAVDFPNVYRWRHMMSLLPATERENWVGRVKRQMPQNPCMTPTKGDPRVQPTESWHRVVNPRSPASPQFKESNLKYNRVPLTHFMKSV